MGKLSGKDYRAQMKPFIYHMVWFTQFLTLRTMLLWQKTTFLSTHFQVSLYFLCCTFVWIFWPFIDSELVKFIALDEISVWRPGWSETFWKKLYYSKHITKQDRKIMRLTYEQVTKRINSFPSAEKFCLSRERDAAKSWKHKFIQNSHIYGTQNGKYKAPLDIIRKYFAQVWRLLCVCVSMSILLRSWVSRSWKELVCLTRPETGKCPIFFFTQHIVQNYLISIIIMFCRFPGFK